MCVEICEPGIHPGGKVAFWNDLKTRTRHPRARVMWVSDWAREYVRRYIEGQDRTDLLAATLVRCPVCTELVLPVTEGSTAGDSSGLTAHPPCLYPNGSDDIALPGRICFRCPKCRGLWETFLQD
jgi:hypothetical protein